MEKPGDSFTFLFHFQMLTLRHLKKATSRQALTILFWVLQNVMKTILIWDTWKLFSITVGYTEVLTIKPDPLLEKEGRKLLSRTRRTITRWPHYFSIETRHLSNHCYFFNYENKNTYIKQALKYSHLWDNINFHEIWINLSLQNS